MGRSGEGAEFVMEMVQFGKTGLTVSRLGLGGYPFGGVNKAHDWDPFTPTGGAVAIATITRALDRGINYIDTAPSYGDGNSERLIGAVMRTRRDECVLATKVGWQLDKQAVIDSVEASLRRLQTDHIDVIQFHGGMFTAEDRDHILEGGPLTALQELRDSGKVRFIGLTAEEPWTARQFIDTGLFDMVQVAYNLIYQAAALHLLRDTAQRGTGVVSMRSMTSGIFQRLAQQLAPEWQQGRDIYTVCLQFLLADPRVHVLNVGMRWSEEVDRNVRIAEEFVAPLDVAELPRLTAGIYRLEDTEQTPQG
jgi:aryl-alcohol dehydrogenase-like predicted oxidoreductase